MKLFKTRKKFEKLIKKTVKSEGKWYCIFEGGIRQGDTEEQSKENAFQLWKNSKALFIAAALLLAYDIEPASETTNPLPPIECEAHPAPTRCA